MAVSAESVKAFLESASLFNNVSEDKRARYLSLYERATKTTSVLTGMPGGGKSDHEAVLASMADVVDDVAKWGSLANYQRGLIQQFLSEVEIEDAYKELLSKRYYYGVGWDIILAQLQWDRPVSRRKMFYDHNKALASCADWINKTGRWKEEIQ